MWFVVPSCNERDFGPWQGGIGLGSGRNSRSAHRCLIAKFAELLVKGAGEHSSSRMALIITRRGVLSSRAARLQSCGVRLVQAEESRASRAAFRAALPGYQLLRHGEIALGTRWPVLEEQLVILPEGPDTRPLLDVTLQVPAGAACT
jgi:hypothetical protein